MLEELKSSCRVQDPVPSNRVSTNIELFDVIVSPALDDMNFTVVPHHKVDSNVADPYIERLRVPDSVIVYVTPVDEIKSAHSPFAVNVITPSVNPELLSINTLFDEVGKYAALGVPPDTIAQ